ncbi:hypothetical protein COLO4_34293 [Corchorus olitorius]|uniref:Uncharacterized protein n=1 Tax=Corchorus olitorius TaxID=93759 RepID=A0A1R3GM89_9ROSI|nr:hypothetical protein COLO4_34293 [Corchorus olitorius]
MQKQRQRQPCRDRCKLEIHAPKLTTFEYFGQFHMVYSTETLTSLDYVCFNLFLDCFEFPEEDFPNLMNAFNEEGFPYLMNTFKVFNHAKALTLSMLTIQVLSKFPALLDQDEYQLSFANLKYLKLKVGHTMRYDNKELQIPVHVLNYFNSSTLLKI